MRVYYIYLIFKFYTSLFQQLFTTRKRCKCIYRKLLNFVFSKAYLIINQPCGIRLKFSTLLIGDIKTGIGAGGFPMGRERRIKILLFYALEGKLTAYWKCRS